MILELVKVLLCDALVLQDVKLLLLNIDDLVAVFFDVFFFALAVFQDPEVVFFPHQSVFINLLKQSVLVFTQHLKF